MIRFTLSEEKIIRCMYRYGTPLTINDISKKTRLSWGTVKTHLENLRRKGYAGSKIIQRVKYWYLKP